MAEPPVARYRLTITLTGNTLDEIEDRLATQVNGGFLLDSDYGKRDSWNSTDGTTTSVMEHRNPDMTPERYAAELDAWWTARKAERKADANGADGARLSGAATPASALEAELDPAEFRTKPNPDQPDRCPSIDPHDTLQCTRRIHEDGQCQSGGIAWVKGTPRYMSDAERANRMEGMAERLAERLVDVEERLTGERDRARGTAATLEAENARLRDGIEALSDEMQSDTCPACHAFYADEGSTTWGCDHTEGMQHAGDMLRALLAEGGE